MTASYPPPLDTLLTQGQRDLHRDWPASLVPGLGSEHIPDLIRMASDDDLHRAASDSQAVFAPVHAWRALGQLRAEQAIDPLLALLRRIDEDDDDWVGEELPVVYGMIGPAAIPPLAAYLADQGHGLWARVASARALQEIGARHPASRDACVAALARQLESFAGQDPELNGFLVLPLVELHALEAAPVMERAFAAGAVEEGLLGDWEDVQIELGLLEKRTRPRKPNPMLADVQRATEALSQVRPRPTPKEEVVRRAERAVREAHDRTQPRKRKRHRRKKAN